jgi:hypothetical protein
MPVLPHELFRTPDFNFSKTTSGVTSRRRKSDLMGDHDHRLTAHGAAKAGATTKEAAESSPRT